MFSGSVKVSNSTQEKVFPEANNIAGNSWFVESLINQARNAAEWVDNQTDDKCSFSLFFTDDSGTKSSSVTVKNGYEVLYALSSFLDGEFYRIRMLLKFYGNLVIPVPLELEESVRQHKDINTIIPILFSEAANWEAFNGLDSLIKSAIRQREKTYRVLKKSNLRGAPDVEEPKKNLFRKLLEF